jgi:hypothetical protein
MKTDQYETFGFTYFVQVNPNGFRRLRQLCPLKPKSAIED